MKQENGKEVVNFSERGEYFADQQREDEKSEWFRSDGDGGQDGDAYNAQLMGMQDMQELRAALNRSELQIQKQGRMQEYVARKPSRAPSATLRRWYGLPRNHRAVSRHAMSAGPSSRAGNLDGGPGANVVNGMGERPRTSATSARPMPPGAKSAEFARILKEEMRQVRELEHRYENTKRSLLEYIEVVTSCKPNDRVGGQEVYEQLAGLIAFAAQCSAAEKHK